MPDNIPLYLFAKAPIPGSVKTRMQPQLSAEQSAALARLMLHQSIEKVSQYWPGKIVLCVAPSQTDPEFIGLAEKYRCGLIEQMNTNLGDRMLHALQNGIESHGAAAVMGCDVPQIDERILTTAYNHLIHGVNTIGPAEDGGFYLFGINQIKPQIFAEVEWGTSMVMKQVMLQSKQVGIQFAKLATLRDIDDWQDLQWLAANEPRYRHFMSA